MYFSRCPETFAGFTLNKGMDQLPSIDELEKDLARLEAELAAWEVQHTIRRLASEIVVRNHQLILEAVEAEISNLLPPRKGKI